MRSDRLIYEPVGPDHLDDFHNLIRDQHIRRYLLDGEVFPREWSFERIRESQDLFETHGLGLWLVREKSSAGVVGFCGFMVIPSVDPEPELVYALLDRFRGRSYATEMASTCIGHARDNSNMPHILASVDEVNTASLHILEKLGFERTLVQQGSFGNMFVLRLPLRSGAQQTEDDIQRATQ